MRIRPLWLVALCVISVLWALYAAALSPPVQLALARLQQRVVPAALPSEQAIAVYPGATNIETNDENAPLSRDLFFTTPDSLDRVLTFYAETYGKQGWTTNDRYITFEDPKFVWSDSERAVPWKLGLGVDVSQQFPGATRYVVWLSRIPNPDVLPVYPAAQDIDVSTATAAEHRGLLQHTITYTVAADPGDILEFYQLNMESYGWNVGEPEGNQVSFGFAYGVPESMYFDHVGVLVGTASSGFSSVKIDAWGYDVHAGTSDPPVAPVVRRPPAPSAVQVYPASNPVAVDDPRGWQSRMNLQMRVHHAR